MRRFALFLAVAIVLVPFVVLKHLWDGLVEAAALFYDAVRGDA